MRNKKRILILLLSLVFALALSACGSAGKGPGGGLKAFVPEEDSGTLYFYGVEKQGGDYYVRVLTEYQEDPAEDALLYVLLAEELSAYFQPVGWVGGWSPAEYWSAKELAQADKKGEISTGAEFFYSITDGCMDYLDEHNYYADSEIDLTTGEPIVSPEKILPKKSGEASFYGVLRSQGSYYALVLQEGSGEEYRYLPLAAELEAYFQDPEWIGGWSPEQYLSAEDLAAADEAGKIGFGVTFFYSMTDNCADYLEEDNSYEGTGTNVTNGEFEIAEEDLLYDIPNGEEVILYLYGVVESYGDYYAQVLPEYEQAPEFDDFLYLPLAHALEAWFQIAESDGPWEPVYYWTAEELYVGDTAGMFTWGAEFVCSCTDGYADYLEELEPGNA